jgi:hypothetical protein
MNPHALKLSPSSFPAALLFLWSASVVASVASPPASVIGIGAIRDELFRTIR